MATTLLEQTRGADGPSVQLSEKTNSLVSIWNAVMLCHAAACVGSKRLHRLQGGPNVPIVFISGSQTRCPAHKESQCHVLDPSL